MNSRKLVISLGVVLLILASAVTVYAATVTGSVPGDCLDAIQLGNSWVCFMGQDINGDDTTTWTYGVKKITGVSGGTMSHITFSICVDDEDGLIAPVGSYATIPSYLQLGTPDDKEFTGRDGIVYNIVVGLDPTTGVVGLKFEDGVPEQGTGELDIFQFTQPTQQNTTPVDTPVGLKDGNGGWGGEMILGPDCTTNAVEITSFKAQSLSLFSRLLQLLGLR